MKQTSRSIIKGFCLAVVTALFSVSALVSATEYSPNFKNTEITEFINIVGKNLKRTIIVDPNVRGGKAAAFRAVNALRLIDISNNLGDAKSLITHPSSSTHRNMTDADRARIGVTDGLVRLSVGLEHADDLAEDLTVGLDQALDAAY